MKALKASELREKSKQALKEDLRLKRREQFKTRLQKSSAEFTNSASIRVVRRDIARLETILAQKCRSEEGKS